jgi:hypothetical protein
MRHRGKKLSRKGVILGPKRARAPEPRAPKANSFACHLHALQVPFHCDAFPYERLPAPRHLASMDLSRAEPGGPEGLDDPRAQQGLTGPRHIQAGPGLGRSQTRGPVLSLPGQPRPQLLVGHEGPKSGWNPAVPTCTARVLCHCGATHAREAGCLATRLARPPISCQSASQGGKSSTWFLSFAPAPQTGEAQSYSFLPPPPPPRLPPFVSGSPLPSLFFLLQY